VAEKCLNNVGYH